MPIPIMVIVLLPIRSLLISTNCSKSPKLPTILEFLIKEKILSDLPNNSNIGNISSNLAAIGLIYTALKKSGTGVLTNREARQVITHRLAFLLPWNLGGIDTGGDDPTYLAVDRQFQVHVSRYQCRQMPINKYWYSCLIVKKKRHWKVPTIHNSFKL